VGEKTPVFTRISTVAGGAGSVDTPRDIRGFAVKFYTKDGEYLVKVKHVTGFTNAEEMAVGLAEVVPFLLEDRLKERGGLFSKGANWGPHVRVDGKLVTGQNPSSSGPAAKALLTLLHSVSTRS
jgi:putative intracellular protease/amidase